MTAQPTPHRFTVQDFHDMSRPGFLDEDSRTELIEGEIIDTSPLGCLHAGCVNRLIRLLTEAISPGLAIVSVQNPVVLDDWSEPQPDLTVLRPRPDFYGAAHPRPEDVLLLVEVAGSSIGWDRRVKMPLYARSGITEVWLVDLGADCVEVNRHPGPDGYADLRLARRGEDVTAETLPVLRVGVTDILG